MFIFKKVLSRIGIGGVKVDLELASSEVTAGEAVEGIVRIQGGSVEQLLHACEINLYAEYTSYETNPQGEQRTRSVKTVIQSYTLELDFVLQPYENRELPCSLLIPLHTPPRLTREKVWLQTAISLEKAVDPSDKDVIEVLPDPLLRRFLNTMERLGFFMVKSRLTENGVTDSSPDPYVHRIVYRVPDEYREELHEVTATPIWMTDALHIALQITRKQGLLDSIAGKDLVKGKIELIPEQWQTKCDDELAAQLEDVIERCLQQA
ncbi:sporulation protein [Paenibacillus alkaliterrae]|uniref:sporulation protein n=1 Tax=Paenibacillus alkaliterrae TaxID=320909 RepID=UPI001F46E561|nr:sporulation protein [Paenibacillus alkaliterrae]MCF2939397.1 sporulation protein [Paenibacillus alkaliterrae]